MHRSTPRPSLRRHCPESMLRLSLGVVLVLCGVPPGGAHAQLPASPALPVVDTLHGTPVADPYRWLEDAGRGEVRAWFDAQGAHARAELDALPGRAALLARIRAIGAAAPPAVSLPREAGGLWFFTMRRAGEAVARGYVRDASTGEERLLVDPATVGGDAGGANALTSFLPSPDGRLVLYGVITGGSEHAALRVRDVESGRDVDGPFERTLVGGDVWSPDGRAVYYIKLPDLPAGAPPTDYYRDVRIIRHRLGEQPGADVPVLSAAVVGEDDRLFPFLEIDGASGVAYGILNTGVGPHSAYFVATAGDLASGTPAWRPLFALADSVIAVAAHGDDLYVLTQKGAPLGRIVRTTLDAPDLAAAETVLPETDQRLRWAGAALDALYVDVFADGTNRITRIPWGDAPIPVTLPPGTSVSQTFDDPFRSQLHVDPLRAGVLLDLASWTAVSRPHRYDPSAGTLEELPLSARGPYDRLRGHAVETVFAPSHDGVLVPLTLIRPDPIARDGSLPVLLDAYGAYGITSAPRFVAERIPWFESGGASATCHVRGGGYHGAAWHRAGQKATKPNTWLDLIACAEFLVREGYTRAERLVAVGTSAGGITVGRAITERPDLFRGAIIQNGVLDAVRFETTPGGPPNTHEFGSVATEAGFRALLAMSAVHHARPQAYPAVLLLTSLGDARVPSWQSGKMAAALQAATTSGRPVLLRVDEAAGHMPATFTDEQRRQGLADVYAFTMAVSGMPAYRPPGGRETLGSRLSSLPLDGAAVQVPRGPAEPIDTVPAVWAAEQQARLDEEFRQLLQDRFDGTRPDWTELMERTTGDTVVMVSERGGVRRLTRTEVMAALPGFIPRLPPEAEFTRTVGDVSVYRHGEVAVVQYVLESRMVFNQEPVLKRFRNTEVFRRGSGEWQTVAYHETVIPGVIVPARIDPGIYDDFVGQYRLFTGYVYTVSRDGDRLMFRSPAAGAAELMPETGSTFVLRGSLYRVLFVRDEEGAVTHLRLREFPGVEYNAIRIEPGT